MATGRQGVAAAALTLGLSLDSDSGCAVQAAGAKRMKSAVTVRVAVATARRRWTAATTHPTLAAAWPAAAVRQTAQRFLFLRLKTLKAPLVL